MASQVPYTGTEDVSPQLNPLPNVHVDTPVAAFGGAVAGAITHMGEVAQGAGKELFARAYAMQELNDQVQADGISADIMNGQTQRYLEFDKLPAAQRTPQATQQYLDDLKSIRQAGMEKATNPYTQQLVLSNSRRNESGMFWHGAVLARQGMDEATSAAGLNNIDALGNKLAALGVIDTGGATFKQSLNDMKVKAAQIVSESSKLGGFPIGSKENDQRSAELISSQIAKVAIARSHADPVDGQTFAKVMHDNGNLSELDYQRISNQLDSGVDNKATSNVARKTIRDTGPNATSKEIDDQARRNAAKEIPGNPNAADISASKAAGMAENQKRLDRLNNQELLTSVTQAIDGTNSKDGKVPINTDHLATEQPEVYAKYLQLDEASQKGVQKILRQNNEIGGVRPNPVGNAQFDRLHTIYANRDSASTPAELQELAEANFLKPPYDSLTRSQRGSLIGWQGEVNNNIAANPNMTHALHLPQVLDMLRSAQIDMTDTSAGSAYNHFQSKYHDAIVAYGMGQERSIKNDETLVGIAKGLINQHANDWFPRLHGYSNKQPFESLTGYDSGIMKTGKREFLNRNQRSPDMEDDKDKAEVERLGLQETYKGWGKMHKNDAGAQP